MNKTRLNELTLSNFQQWPELVKYFVLSVFLLMFISIYYFLSFSSNFYQYKSLTDEEKNIKAEFEAKQKLTNLNAYNEQLAILDKIYTNKLNKLVKNNEISSLLNEISQIALSSGLAFEFFAPKTESKIEFPKALSLSMIVIGEYHNLAQFLSRISSLKKLIVFEDFEVNKKEIDNKGSKLEPANILRMKIRIKIYKYS